MLYFRTENNHETITLGNYLSTLLSCTCASLLDIKGSESRRIKRLVNWLDTH